jgi:hypothetical protein
MAAAHAEYWLLGFLYYFKDARQRFWRIVSPRMTLATQNNVGSAERHDTLERHRVKGLSQYLEIFAHTTQHLSQFARARALTVERVVDEIYKRG